MTIPKNKVRSLLEIVEDYSSMAAVGLVWVSDNGEIYRISEGLMLQLGFSDHDTALQYYSGNLSQLIANTTQVKEILDTQSVAGCTELKRTLLNGNNKRKISATIFSEIIFEEEGPLITLYIMVPEQNISLDTREGSGIHLRSLFGSIHDFYYIKNSEGNLLAANKKLLDLAQVSDLKQLRELTGKAREDIPVLEVLHDDEKFIRKVIDRHDDTSGMESEAGLTDHYAVRRVAVFNKETNSVVFFIFGHDFMDLATAEDGIVDNQTHLHAIIESAKDGIWLIDTDCKIVKLNHRFKKFIQDYFGKEAKIGTNGKKIFSNDLNTFWEDIYRKALGGQNDNGEIFLQHQGQDHYYEYKAHPVWNNKRNVVGATFFLSDITERKKAQDAVRINEARFRQLAENINDALILTEDDRVIYVNPALMRLFGIEQQQFDDIPEILENQISGFQRDLIMGKSENEVLINQGIKFLMKNSGKEDIELWIRSYPISGDRQNPDRNLTVISDIKGYSILETAISTSRMQQKAILDNIPYLAWLKDDQGRYILVNEPFAEFFGLDKNKIIGKNDQEIFPENIASRHQNYDQTVRQAKRRKFFEDNWGLKGVACWMETFSTSILDSRGEVIGITGISRDITDRKSMEDTIIKNEEHFRSLLQYSSDSITILDKKGTIVFESSLRNRISDFMIDELIGKPFGDIIHPEDVEIFDDVLESVLEEPGIQIKREYRSLHKNKKWIYVESIFSNHLNNPSIRGIVVNTRDISDRKMAELKERVYHDNLIFLSNSALELLSLSDREDIFKFIAEKLFRFLEEAIVIVCGYNETDGVFIIKHIKGAEESWSKLEKLLGKNPIGIQLGKGNLPDDIDNSGNIRTLNKPFSSLNVDLALKPVLENTLEMLNVNKVYVMTMARDNKLLGSITILTLNKTIIKFKHIIETFAHQVSVALQRSQLEYELLQAKTKAEESDKLKTAFLANMSHEIRTPMNGILGFAEMLNDDQLSEGNRKKYVEIINNNGKMLMSLIDDVIDFAKIEARQIKILQQEFSLNALLSQVHSSFLSESLRKERKEVKLKIRKSLSNEDCYIQSDPNRVRQILTNLVGNAFKFTKEGVIEFGYNPPKEDMLEFFVRDTGIGIPEDKITLIFERFVQADYSRSRKYSGSGLGLAISKGFVELLGGTMWAESKENVGSVFYFTIPYIPAKKKSIEEIESKKPKAEYNWEGKLFLVAEDDMFSYKLLEGFLKKTGADILHAEDGLQAVDMCKKEKNIDLILMDVQMPEMNGMEATRIIKKMRNDLPIIAQTANAIAEERQRCFEAGFDEFVTKPINISELFIKIDQCLMSS
jgi:PAS domain S-box-containing protein